MIGIWEEGLRERRGGKRKTKALRPVGKTLGNKKGGAQGWEYFPRL